MFKLKQKNLIPLIEELEGCLKFKENIDKTVSISDIGWHIDHSLKVINVISDLFIGSNPNMYSGNFNKWRLLFFSLGYFPRGKVKAPKLLRPAKIILMKDLESQFQLTYNNIISINKAHKNAYFKHPIFGILNKKQTIRFLELHTNHHLKIIRDILK